MDNCITRLRIDINDNKRSTRSVEKIWSALESSSRQPSIFTLFSDH
ncbi:MAG: hypothetical protein ACLSFJ_03155 [Holdemania filiformis]